MAGCTPRRKEPVVDAATVTRLADRVSGGEALGVAATALGLPAEDTEEWVTLHPAAWATALALALQIRFREMQAEGIAVLRRGLRDLEHRYDIAVKILGAPPARCLQGLET